MNEVIKHTPDRPAIAPGPYRHYRFGHIYQVLHIALNENTQAWDVVYQDMTTGHVFTRPAAQWSEPVEHSGRKQPRFAQVTPDYRQVGP
jgi:hypothetical protein